MTSVKPLPPERRTGDADTLRADYLRVINHAITNHPRSQQVAIGPSEIGVECDRRIAYKLLGVPERPSAPAWLPTIGTAVHAWLEAAFDADNASLMDAEELGVDEERWLIEERVTPGFVPGLGFITGSCDLYDRVTCTVVDHKIVGPSSLKKYRGGGPSQQYRVQAHLYGKGWANAGHPVKSVAIHFLPRNAASLSQAYLWSEPYDPAIADAALERLTRIWRALEVAGKAVLPALPMADAHCTHCPWLSPGNQDATTGCPGVAGVSDRSASQLDGLLA